MSSGLLGKAILAANTPTVVYAVPNNVEFVTLNISAVNTSDAVGDSAIVKVAISTTDIPNSEDYVEYGISLSSNGGILERTGVICSPGEKINIISSNSSVVVRVHGIEEIM